MPELRNRDKYEEVTTNALAQLQEQQRQRLHKLLASGKYPDQAYWDQTQRELAMTLYLIMVPVFEASVHKQSTVNPKLAVTAATDWASRRANELAQGINETSQRLWTKLLEDHNRNKALALYLAYLMVLDDDEVARSKSGYSGPAVGRDGPLTKAQVDSAAKGAEPLPSGLDQIFGPSRASTIAVTTITDADSAGTIWSHETSKGKVTTYPSDPDVTRGLATKLVWVTAEDEKVCPICRPLDQADPEEWSEEFPDGPPAHPNCRCYLEFREL